MCFYLILYCVICVWKLLQQILCYAYQSFSYHFCGSRDTGGVCLFVFFFGEIAAKRKHLGYRTTRYQRHRNGGREIGRPNKNFHSNNFLVCITQCKIGHKHACMIRGSGPLLVFYKSQRPERAEIWGKQNCARILLWWCIKPMLFWFYLPVRCCLFL